MDIDLPEVVAEVRAEFDGYEKALGDNDVGADEQSGAELAEQRRDVVKRQARVHDVVMLIGHVPDGHPDPAQPRRVGVRDGL